jgi:hypothetical protein
VVYKLTKSCHNMDAVELIDGDPIHHAYIRRCVTAQYTSDEAYQRKHLSAPFLQGQDDPTRYSNSQWTLVEFWGQEPQAFVDWLNEQIKGGEHFTTFVKYHNEWQAALRETSHDFDLP